MSLRETIKNELSNVLIQQYSMNKEGQWYSISENAIEWFLDKVVQKLQERGCLKDGEISED